MGTCTSSFSVGSCYRKEANLKAEDTNNSFWQKLWKLEIHDQIKIFLWKVTVNVIPIRDALDRRISGIDVCCPICGDELETRLHLFKDCAVVKVLVFACKWNFRLEA